MANDLFTDTNNPLPSPWVSITTSAGDLLSTGGEAKRAAAGECGMVYSTSTATMSEVVVGTSPSVEDGGPCLMTTGGNGYLVSNINAVDIVIVKYAAWVFSSESSVVGTYGAGDTLRLYFDGNDVVLNKNTVEINRWTDSTYRTGCKPGIQIGNADMGMTSWTDGVAAGAPLQMMHLSKLMR